MMTYEQVQRIPPDGTEAVDMLALSDCGARIHAVSDIRGDMVFSVYCQADAARQITVAIGNESMTFNVGTAWQRIEMPADGTDDVYITAAGNTIVYLYKAQLETGTVASGWKPAPEDTEADIASAQGAAENAQDAANVLREDFRRVVRINDDGLHVGDNQSGSEVLIDSESVNVVLNGQRYSQFAADYVQFGNYQMRQSADGGLVFKLKGGYIV